MFCLISYNAIYTIKMRKKNKKQRIKLRGLSSLHAKLPGVFAYLETIKKRLLCWIPFFLFWKSFTFWNHIFSFLPLTFLLFFFSNRFASATSLPPWGKMLCQQCRYSWHQVSKNPRIKAAIIHNTCLSRHHSAQSFYTPIRLKLYITCGESAGGNQ